MRHFAVVMALAATSCAFAEPADSVAESKSELLNLNFRARADWQGDWHGSAMDNDASGFKGEYLMMRLDGEIIPGLTYSWRQRFNKNVTDGHFFDATDWININYAVKGWHFSAGKQVVAIGGWEYDRNPVDLYGCSVFWQNIPCYQFGISASYDLTPHDNLLFQVSQSMWHAPGMRNIYSYNLLWTGHHGPLTTLWSANLAEYAKGRYISYLALGNRVDMGPLCLELDLMNRAAAHQTFFFRDCSVMGELAYKTPDERWRLHAKITYDVNKTHTNADLTVLPGTELTMAGGGVEFFPLKKKRTLLRLHAGCYYSWGRNTNESDLMQSKTTLLSVGVTWDMNILKLHRKK